MILKEMVIHLHGWTRTGLKSKCRIPIFRLQCCIRGRFVGANAPFDDHAAVVVLSQDIWYYILSKMSTSFV